MVEIVTRPAQTSDRAACAALYARVWPLAFPGFERAIDQATFDADTEGEEIFVALRDEKIIGFAGYYAPGNFLHHLYVDPDAQGQGAGTALLKAIQAQAANSHGMGGLSLKVQVSNTRARAFYASRGFIEGGLGNDAHGLWVRCTAP